MPHDDEGATGREHVHVTIQSRAILKVNAAAKHFEAVHRGAVEWVASRQPLLAPVRRSADAVNTIEIFEPQGYDPPVLGWESGFVDGVHNLRSALDALAMELAYVDGRVPSDESDISFPIVPTKATGEAQELAWQTAKTTRALAETAPAQLMERIKAIQDWRHPETLTPSFLSVLASVDNDDKHRFGIEVWTMPSKLLQLRALPVPEDAPNTLWSKPWVELSLNMPAPAKPALVDLEDNILPLVSIRGQIGHLFDLQRCLLEDMKRCIEFISTGTWPPEPALELYAPDAPILADAGVPNMRRLAAQRPRADAGQAT